MSLTYRKTKTILDDICDNKVLEVEKRMSANPLEVLKEKIKTNGFEKRDFYAALANPGLSLIAEIKYSSPSAEGRIFSSVKPEKIAKTYEKNGARAISVLTDEKFFLGKLEFISRVRAACNLPILRKDFIIHPYQLYEAKACGADAVLLIASILKKTRLKELYSLAGELGLDVLMEIHDAHELKTTLERAPKIIGINNRDLKTMKIDLNTFSRLSKLIPANIIKVAESGIKTREDAEQMRKSGADAILVGATLMQAKDIGKIIDTLI